VIQIKIDAKLNSLIDRFIEETNEKQKGYEFIIENISNEIAITLIRLFSCNSRNPYHESSNDERKNIHEVMTFLNANYNSNYSTSEIAKIANLSPFHFIRVFKSQTGKTPYEYLLNLRIGKAQKMLGDKRHSITEICFLCGFSNLSHFATAFKKHTGMTPSQYRVNLKE
jgi:transcriptional regulator GlxA family with amidase domain